MTSTAKVLVASQDAPNAQTAVYTSPAAGRGTWIDKATATNYSGGAVQLSVNIVPNAGAASNANLLVKQKSIAAGSTDLLPELVGKLLAPGESISVLASAATSVNLALNGRELT